MFQREEIMKNVWKMSKSVKWFNSDRQQNGADPSFRQVIVPIRGPEYTNNIGYSLLQWATKSCKDQMADTLWL